jgi:hypothetical protein
MTPKQRDAYYRREYGIAAAEHDERGKGGCEICGSTGKTRGLPADHDPKVRKRRIKVVRTGKHSWVASADGCANLFGSRAANARAAMRECLKTLSYRGAACFNCNRGLRCFFDNPERLNNAALYLRAYQNKLGQKA